MARNILKGNDEVSFYANYAIARRAYQVQLIGADYTYAVKYKDAEPEMLDLKDPSYRRPFIHGLYRCDTFVINAFRATNEFNNEVIHPWRWISSQPSGWGEKISDLSSILSAITPSIIFDKQRKFQGYL